MIQSGLRQQDLAIFLNVSPSMVCHILNGQKELPLKHGAWLATVLTAKAGETVAAPSAANSLQEANNSETPVSDTWK